MAKIPFKLEAWLKDMSRKVVDEDGDSVDPSICSLGWLQERQNRLFIVIPEDELTPFEQSIKDRFFYGELAIEESEIKEIASELLSLAREQIKPEFNAMLKEAYKTADEVMYRKGKEDGIVEARNDISARIVALKQAKDRAEDALKDLPRWSTNSDPDFNPGKYFCVANALISPQGWSIPFKDLERLPGFKKE